MKKKTGGGKQASSNSIFSKKKETRFFSTSLEEKPLCLPSGEKRVVFHRKKKSAIDFMKEYNLLKLLRRGREGVDCLRHKRGEKNIL